jgi:hypothetical protein
VGVQAGGGLGVRVTAGLRHPADRDIARFGRLRVPVAVAVNTGRYVA